MDNEHTVPQGMRESTPVERILDLAFMPSSRKQESPGFSRGECQKFKPSASDLCVEIKKWCFKHWIMDYESNKVGFDGKIVNPWPYDLIVSLANQARVLTAYMRDKCAVANSLPFVKQS